MTIHTEPAAVFGTRPGIRRTAAPHVMPKPDAGTQAMAEAMREIVYRDGAVTEAALMAEGFTAAEIIENAAEARRLAGLAIVVEGRRRDRLPDVIEKAREAVHSNPPVMNGQADTSDYRDAWGAYCRAIAAHRIDPWVSQSGRCLARLEAVLVHMPLLIRERNRIHTAVAMTLKRRCQA